MSGCDFWGPDGRLDTLIDQIDLWHMFDIYGIYDIYTILANKFDKTKKIEIRVGNFFPL